MPTNGESVTNADLQVFVFYNINIIITTGEILILFIRTILYRDYRQRKIVLGLLIILRKKKNEESFVRLL